MATSSTSSVPGCISNEVSCYSLLHHGGPSIAHLETQYSWAHIRLAAYSQGSRPTGMERRPRRQELVQDSIFSGSYTDFMAVKGTR